MTAAGRRAFADQINWKRTAVFGIMCFMKTVLDMASLTRDEKLRAMEELWDDLSRSADEYPSPEWHGHVLRERDAALKAGKDSFVPWDEAKRMLRERPR